MKEILYPVNGYRGALTQKGIKPKDHQKDNLELIKRKHQEFIDKEALNKQTKKESKIC